MEEISGFLFGMVNVIKNLIAQKTGATTEGSAEVTPNSKMVSIGFGKFFLKSLNSWRFLFMLKEFVLKFYCTCLFEINNFHFEF